MTIELLQHWVVTYGYAALFASLMFGIVGLPIPDETLLALSGYLVYKGHFAFVPTCLAAFLGSISGISLSFIIGRSGGHFLLAKYGPRFHVTEERLETVNRWFERIGKWILVVGYFIPGIRHVTALVAGSSKMRYPVFAGFAYAGGILWSTTFVSLGYFLGESWIEALNEKNRIIITVIGGLGIIGAVAVWFLKAKKKKVRPDKTKEDL